MNKRTGKKYVGYYNDELPGRLYSIVRTIRWKMIIKRHESI